VTETKNNSLNIGTTVQCVGPDRLRGVWMHGGGRFCYTARPTCPPHKQKTKTTNA
jgi:hypothetical protein